jgi:phosphomannomutase
MGNRARQLQTEGYEILFAFEEAIGFAIGGRVVDKDGVSAAVILAELAIQVHAAGRTLVDELARVFARYGHHCSKVSYYICHEPETIREIFNNVRAAYPTAFGPYAVRGIRDVTTGYDSREPDSKCKWPKQSGQMITFYLENSVITLRTSGTEPKIKYYAEIILPPRADG